MRRVLLGVLLFAGQGTVHAAECPPGTKTQVIGTVATANDTTGATNGYKEITQQGHDVRMMTVSCGSACVATLYDTDSTIKPAPLTDARVKAEPGAPANESRTYVFDPPLSFQEGISFHDDANVSAIILYECRP